MRIARAVALGIPHHITQRGNARQTVFDNEKDRRVYLELLRYYTDKHRLRIWAWCLMSNHIHLLAVPETADTLKRTLARTHRDYACYRNAQLATCGHLWQSRYYSCPVDQLGLWPAMAYIERNPVRAGLVVVAEDFGDCDRQAFWFRPIYRRVGSDVESRAEAKTSRQEAEEHRRAGSANRRRS